MSSETTSSPTTSAEALSDDDAFSKGFENANSNEDTFVSTTETAQPAQTTEQVTAQPVTQVASPSPAAAPAPVVDDLAAKFARLEAQLANQNDATNRMIERLRSVEGRTGQLSGDFKQIRTSIHAAPTVTAAPAPATAFDKLREEYP